MVLDLVEKLVDRLIQLATYRKQVRQQLLDEHVKPVFEAFEAVHREYLASFAKYRDVLKGSADPFEPNHPLLEAILTDNLFTQHERSRILELGQAADDPEVGPFMTAIRDYLVDTRIAEDPIAGYRGDYFIGSQHWRRSLLRELETIFARNWQTILDPDASAPPLYGEALLEALADVRRRAGIPVNDPRATDRTKAYFAVKALDEVVAGMQDAYTRVAGEYARLRQVLMH